MKTAPTQQTSTAQKPRQAQMQMRALLHGDIRMVPLLTSKVVAALRARYYLRRCTKVGRFVRVYGCPLVQNDGVIEIGDNVLIFSTTVRVELVAMGGGRLEIGAESSVNYGFSAAAHQLVHIGKRCAIGPYVNIIDNSYHDVLDRSRKPPSRPVIIGDDVWIAGHVIILPGVTIGDHAVISAGAVVSESVPERSVVAGNPAQIIAQF
jgi:acetyltransferase-like isoleucine patch superfamily enzyme